MVLMFTHVMPQSVVFIFCACVGKYLITNFGSVCFVTNRKYSMDNESKGIDHLKHLKLIKLLGICRI